MNPEMTFLNFFVRGEAAKKRVELRDVCGL